MSLFISLRIMIIRYTFLQQNKLHSSVQVLSKEKREERAMVVSHEFVSAWYFDSEGQNKKLFQVQVIKTRVSF